MSIQLLSIRIKKVSSSTLVREHVHLRYNATKYTSANRRIYNHDVNAHPPGILNSRDFFDIKKRSTFGSSEVFNSFVDMTIACDGSRGRE
jgi:hypothetical protein